MFISLKDRIKFEEIIDCESKLKVLIWESDNNFHNLYMASNLKLYNVLSDLTGYFINTIPFDFDNQCRKQILYENKRQQPNEVIII